MGLYLAIFDDGDEIGGVEVGSYDDFDYFRNLIIDRLEGGVAGSRFPTLIMHSDCDGEWTPAAAKMLENELVAIAKAFKSLGPVPYNSEWQRQVAHTFGITPSSLYDCLFDVDGEPLLNRLIDLARLSQERNLPILFQ